MENKEMCIISLQYLVFFNQNLLVCTSLTEMSFKALIPEPQLFITSLYMQPGLHRDVSSG